MNLTKSDFKVAQTCPTKLFYKKLRYASLNDDNPYLQFLADGGYMVEKMAKLLFPTGRELQSWRDPVAAFRETSQAIEAGEGVLFEATILFKNLLARIDILCVEDTTFRLIEVKASSIDSTNDGANPFRTKKGRISSEWQPYLEDVTFQTSVLRGAFPEFKIVPFLCVVDKAKTATANVTFDKFRLHRKDQKLVVDYVGDVKKLQNEHVLAMVDVSGEVKELQDEVQKATDKFTSTLRVDPISKIPPEIGRKCKKCEYRLIVGAPAKTGFRECWGKLADAVPHALDIYRVDVVGGVDHDAIAELASKGRSRLTDLPPELLTGGLGIRQRLQLECTVANKEYFGHGLRDLLSGHPYPLHFIDFEGSRLAIPYHQGMRAYEQASFQWSCHTIRKPNEEVDHSEWLNSDEAFPNFEFARRLRDQLGDKGTIYIWSNYEVAILREVRQQMEKYAIEEPDLTKWLDTITAEENPRVVDLCATAKDYYFHPMMGGSLSIKHVLPAVWTSDANVRAHPLFKEYVRFDQQGNLLDPYATLPPLPIGGEEELVKEGTGAMRVYQEMMFGESGKDPVSKENYRKLLRQYCKLDTAAMVAVWMHWKDATAEPMN